MGFRLGIGYRGLHFKTQRISWARHQIQDIQTALQIQEKAVEPGRKAGGI